MNKLKTFLLFLLGLLFAGFLAAQEPEYLRLIRNPTPGITFDEIRQKAETWFKDRDTGKGSGYTQWKRWEYLHQNLLGPSGELLNESKVSWDAWHRYLGTHASQKTEITNGNWFFLAATDWTAGPLGNSPGLGRVNCIAFHPTQANTFFIGTPAGGIWKTTNHGTSWIPLSDGLPSIGISGIAVDPGNANTLYILTGDGDGFNTRSIGVLKTTNGGETWLSTGLSYEVTDAVFGFKLLIHPANPNTLWSVQTDGLWQTNDAGANWTLVKSGSFRDLEFKPGDPGTMYAVKTDTFFRSTNGGNSWQAVFSGLPSGASRIAIGITPDNPNYVYLLSGPGGSGGAGTFKGFLVSANSGINFVTQSTTPNILGQNSGGGDSKDQSGYDLAVAVSRTNYAEVIAGGINTWRSADFGINWTITSHWQDHLNNIGYTHADIHALEINPLNNYLYCGSDGGIFYSTNFGDDWIDLSPGLANTQWYRIAGYAPDPDLIIGGSQDNGTNKYTGSATMTQIFGDDGMDCQIDPSDPNILYICRQGGGLHKSTDGGNTFNSIQPTGSTGSWVTPFVLDPSNSNIIYAGYDDVYKSTDGGGSWTNTGVDGRGVLAIGTDNPNRIYAGLDTFFWRSGDGAATWTSKSAGLPPNNLSGIAVNPDNSLEVYVSIAGFSDGKKVYRSTDAGDTWTNYSGGLPNVAIHCLAFEDNNGTPGGAIYAGTSVGVFYLDNNLSDWIPFSNWLPTVPVYDLEINHGANLIVAGTFGRGLWRSDTYTPCQSSWNLCCTGGPGYTYYQASDTIFSTRAFTAGSGQKTLFKAGQRIRLKVGFRVKNGSKFRGWLGPCGGGIPTARIMGYYDGPMEGAVEVTSGLPLKDPGTHLLVYPNPFESITNVEFVVTGNSPVSISLLDPAGRTVAVLLQNRRFDPGSYKVGWNASSFPSGAYFVHLKTGDFHETQKILLAK
jgi:hypothetical protein